MASPKLVRRMPTQGTGTLPTDDDVDREAFANWQFLLASIKTGSPRIDILIGESDRLRRGLDILATQASNLQMTVLPGGHNWTVWRQLWEKWLMDQEQIRVRSNEIPCPVDSG